MDNLCSESVIWDDFRSIVGSPRWIAIFKFNNSVRDFFVDGWLLLWCEEVLASVFVDGNLVFEPIVQRKETYLTNQTTNAFNLI